MPISPTIRDVRWVRQNSRRQPTARAVASGSVEDEKYSNKFRSTLAHETGHILTLREAYQREGNVVSGDPARRYSCNPNTKDHQSHHDWAEWQADYCIGALLIPRGSLKRASDLPHRRCIHSWPTARLDCSSSQMFQTSYDVARLRLYGLGYLCNGQSRFHFAPWLNIRATRQSKLRRS